MALDQTTGSKQWWEDYEVKDWNHLFYLSDPFTLCVVCKRPSLWNLSNFNCHPPSPVSLFFCHSSGWAKYQGQCNSSTTVLDPPRCSYGGLCHTFLAWQSAVLNPSRFSYVGLCHTFFAHHLLNRAATSIDPCFKKLREFMTYSRTLLIISCIVPCGGKLVHKQKTMKFDVVRKQPTTKYIKISWTD